jgi:hypothetical protein
MVKVYIYTAIFGGYDTPPTIKVYDEEVGYYCFTDEPIQDIHPWENVITPRFFRDNKLNSGFLKANAHLLFPWNSVVVWMDANLTDVTIGRKKALELVGDEGIAVPKHPARNSVFGEAAMVAEYNLDNKIRISRWEDELRTLGYPDNVGLAETNLLIRDLRVPKVRAANREWWDSLLRCSRRDQLSFNPALWSNGLSWNRIETDDYSIEKRDELFKLREHKAPGSRFIDNQSPLHNLEMIAPYFWHEIELPKTTSENYPAISVYPHEFWDSETLVLLREINGAVEKSQENLEDNYCHFHNSQVCSMSVPDVRRSWKREYLRRSTLPAKFGMEIGFNAGHSAAIMLGHNPALKLLCLDSGTRNYCSPCADLISERFKHRFRIHYGNSREVLYELAGIIPLQELDFVHLDGSREVNDFIFDIGWFMELAPVGCRLIVNNIYETHISEITQFLLNKNLLQPYNPGLPSCGENKLFVKRSRIQSVKLDSLLKQHEFINKDLAIKNLGKAVADKDFTIKNLEKVVADRDFSIKNLEKTIDDLRENNIAKDDHINEIYNTISWKIITPLRYIREKAKSIWLLLKH